MIVWMGIVVVGGSDVEFRSVNFFFGIDGLVILHFLSRLGYPALFRYISS